VPDAGHPGGRADDAGAAGGDLRQAEQELGWKHRPLGETLADEVAWYRAQGLGAAPATRATAVAA